MSAPPRFGGRNWPVMRRDGEIRQLPPPSRPPEAALPTLRTSQNACYEALSLALREGHVFAALTGPAGSGKTTVLEAVLADRRDRSLRCIRINDPDKVPASLAAQIEQVAYAEAGKPENLERHVVLAVDDAHLASDDMLLCLARLAAMREPGRRVPQIVLSGRPELWDRLATDEYEPLARRLAIRAALPAVEDDVDPWAIVEDEVTQTMAKLRADAERFPTVADQYDELAEREALFGTAYGHSSGSSQSPVAQPYDDDAAVPPPSVFALFPDPPPTAQRSTARETRRRLLMPLASLFVGLAAFAFALSFYDWPDLLADMPWADAKPSEPFVMPRSPQDRTYGLPMAPNLSATGADKPAAASALPPKGAARPAATASTLAPPAPSRPAPLASAAPPPAAPPPAAPAVTPRPETAPAWSPRPAEPVPTTGTATALPPIVLTPLAAAPTPVQPSPSPTASAPLPAAPVAAAPAPAPSAPPVPTPPAAPPQVTQPSTATPPAASNLAEAPAAPAPVEPPSPRTRAAAAEGPLPAGLVALLLRRGDEQSAIGDISAARLLYERAAESGSGLAARQLARTYDSAFLPSAVEGALADRARARHWYERAAALGNADAALRLKTINLRN